MAQSVGTTLQYCVDILVLTHQGAADKLTCDEDAAACGHPIIVAASILQHIELSHVFKVLAYLAESH